MIPVVLAAISAVAMLIGFALRRQRRASDFFAGIAFVALACALLGVA